MKVALAQINPIIGDLKYNREKILSYLEEARKKGAELVIFPEMALSGYPPEDLLVQKSYVEAVERGLHELAPATSGITAIIGGVRKNPAPGEKALFNTAAIFSQGELIGFQDKSLLPDYDVFSERRYFEPSTDTKIWNLCGKRVAITVCEDIWQHADAVEYTSYLRDPILELSKLSPDLLINISASPFYVGRQKMRWKVVGKAAQTLRCPALFCNQVGGNDSLIFDGTSLYVDKRGELLWQAASFKEDLLLIDTEMEGKPIHPTLDLTADLFHALVLGVRDYFFKQGFKKACIGFSGGIDSAVTAAIVKEALGPSHLLLLMLPSRFTTEASLLDARNCAKKLELPYKEVPIEAPFESFLNLLEPLFENKTWDVTEENLQARIRGVILMSFSNKFGYILVGTGNKSEMAMGYTTLYGDMCGGLGVLADVSKKSVYDLARWINRHGEIIPSSMIEKPPSAELKANQKDTDSLPEYNIVDAVLTGYVEEHLSPEEIAEKYHIALPLVKELIHKIHRNEYKRRQAPIALRVTRKAFSIGRRFPIVQHWNNE